MYPLRAGLHVLSAIVLVLALGHSAPVAAAPPGPQGKVAVLPLTIDGELDDYWRQVLSKRLRDGLGRGDFEIVQADAASPCADAGCIRRVAKSTGAQYVVRARVTVADTDYRVRLELVDGESGEVRASVDQPCEPCGASEVAEQLADQAGILRQKVEPLLLGPPSLEVGTDPGGATVWVDGATVGVAPVQRELTPGKHVVRAEKKGYVATERQITAVQGVRESLTLRLDRLPGRRLAPWGGALLGIGVAATAAGATLLILDNREYQRDCNADRDGNCEFTYDTLGGGIASTAIGVAAIAAGIGLVVAGRKRDRRRRAWLVPTGTGFALVGRL